MQGASKIQVTDTVNRHQGCWEMETAESCPDRGPRVAQGTLAKEPKHRIQKFSSSRNKEQRGVKTLKGRAKQQQEQWEDGYCQDRGPRVAQGTRARHPRHRIQQFSSTRNKEQRGVKTLKGRAKQQQEQWEDGYC